MMMQRSTKRNDHYSRALHAASLAALLLLSLTSFAQQSNSAKQNKAPIYLPLNREFTRYIEDSAHAANDLSVHTAIRPYLHSEVPGEAIFGKDSKLHIGGKTTDASNYSIRFVPLAALQGGYDLKTSSPAFLAEGGLMLEGTITKKLAWSGSVLAGRSTFPSYFDSIIEYGDVVPGFGRAYGSDGKYSYQQYSGYLSYSPNKVFNFQIGQDKNFIGEGYRSMFLSDAAANYPFLKVSTNVWRLKYMNLFMRLTDMQGFAKKDHLTKYTAIHYLSYNATKWLNLSLFESIVFKGGDSASTRNFDINYLNPVIFYRPVEYSLGSADNAFLGAGFRLKLLKNYHIYGQLLLDEFLLSEVRARRGWWGNKNAWQIGLKSFDLFGVKNLYLQGEISQVRPYTYSHMTIRQSYSHMNQPLAHPLGANFREAIGFLGYRVKSWMFEGKLAYSESGKDTSAVSYGGNVLLSYKTRPGDFGHHLGQGLETKLAIADLRAAYLIYPPYNLQVELRVTQRLTRTTRQSNLFPFIQLGLKTALWNFYDDF